MTTAMDTMITKELKYATFFYNEETKEFSIVSKGMVGADPAMTLNSINLNKTYAFAFSRFVLRISQRNFNRKFVAKAQELGAGLK